MSVDLRMFFASYNNCFWKLDFVSVKLTESTSCHRSASKPASSGIGWRVWRRETVVFQKPMYRYHCRKMFRCLSLADENELSNVVVLGSVQFYELNISGRIQGGVSGSF